MEVQFKRLRNSRGKQQARVTAYRQEIAKLMAAGGCTHAAAWAQLEVKDSEAILPAVVRAVKYNATASDLRQATKPTHLFRNIAGCVASLQPHGATTSPWHGCAWGGLQVRHRAH